MNDNNEQQHERRRYNVIPDVDRQRLVTAFQDGQDYIQLAQRLGIARQTARNIIIRFRQRGNVLLRPRGGAHNRKIDEEMVVYWMEKIEIKTTITLKELVEQIRIDLPHKPHVTHQAASKTLDGRMYTIKDLRPVPAQWNTPERIDERVEFANYLMGDGLHVHKIFIDEFGFNVWTSRSKGRALRGQRAVRIVEGQRGKNVTVCLAISPVLGLVHSSIIEGGMKQELFAGFIMELAELLRYNDDPYVLLCDSVSSHLNAPNFGDQGQLKYLPKYSPFLNACEMAGSCLKAAVKRKTTEPAVQQEIYNREAPRNETLHNRRMRIVSREIENGLPTITVQKCAQYLNHVMGYMPRCIRRDPIYE